jgi:hypothetical protein
MKWIRPRHIECLLALLPTLGAWADTPSSDSFLQIEPLAATHPGPASGKGHHVVRFVVRDPTHPDRPHKRGGYRIMLSSPGSNAPFLLDLQGTTDALGHTLAVRTESPMPTEQWIVLPSIGEGPKNRIGRVTSDDGFYRQQPYMFNITDAGVFCGVSAPDGHTVNVRTRRNATLSLFAKDDLAACQRLESTIKRALEAGDVKRSQAVFAQALKELTWSDAEYTLLQDKLLLAMARKAPAAAIEDYLQRRILDTPGMSNNEKANLFNAMAYSLVTVRQPGLPDLALNYIEQSLALHAYADPIDTKAWILHLLGRDDEALKLLNEAMDRFHQTCTLDNEEAYLETRGHLAEVLWTLGRHESAIDLWAQASLSDPAEDWASSLTHYFDQGMKVQQRAGELRASKGEAATYSCADHRDGLVSLKAPLSGN